MSTSNLQEPLIATSESESSILKELDQKFNRTSKTCGLVIGIILGVFTQVSLFCMIFFLIQAYGEDFMKNHKVYIVSGLSWSTFASSIIISIISGIDDLFSEIFHLFHPNNTKSWNRIQVEFVNRVVIGLAIGNQFMWFFMDLLMFGGFKRDVFSHALFTFLLQLGWCYMIKVLFKDGFDQDEQTPDEKSGSTSNDLDLV